MMIAKGFNSYFPMDRLSVMGLVEPFKRLPELLRIRRRIKQLISSVHLRIYLLVLIRQTLP